MLTFDTLWYHGPFAARIADTGSVWGMHFVDPALPELVLPAELRAPARGGDRPLRSRPRKPLDQLRLAWARPRRRLVHRPPLRRCPALADRGRDRDGHRPDGPPRGRHPGHRHRPGCPDPGRSRDPDQCLGHRRAATWTTPGAGPEGTPAVAARQGRTADSALAERPPSDPAAAALPLAALLIAGLAAGLALGTKLTVSGPIAVLRDRRAFIVPPGFRRRALGVFVAGRGRDRRASGSSAT